MIYNPIFFITGATLSGGKVALTVNGSPSLNTKSVARFLFAANIAVPTGATADSEVVLSINGTEYDLLDKFAMPMTLSELPSNEYGAYFATRRPIVCGVGDDGGTPATPFFVSWNLPVPKEYIIPLR